MVQLNLFVVFDLKCKKVPAAKVRDHLQYPAKFISKQGGLKNRSRTFNFKRN